MTDTPKPTWEQLFDRSYVSKPPLRLIIPIAVVSLLIVSAGTMFVLAQNSGGSEAAGQNASAADGPIKTITVGPDDSLTFEPENLSIQQGTTVRFEWDSDNHNIVVEDQPEGADWKGHEQLEREGYSLTHTFTTNGTYEFYSQPYEAAGMTGKIVVGQGQPEPSVKPSYANESPQIAVGPNGTLGFKPSGESPLVVESGTTVTFNWESSGHNVVVKEQPAKANWRSHPEIEEEGYSMSHTFNTTGVYKFVGEPHESAGASGTIIVVDSNSST